MKIKKNTIVLIVVVVAIVGAVFYLESMKASPGISSESLEDEVQEIDLKDGIYPKAPELAGISGYLNTDGEEIKISDLEGKVVLVDFWTYSCINCIRTLPFLTAWDEKYRDKGLVIIGVHTPEFEFEKNAENVKASAEKHGVEYAIVQDNDYSTWRAYQNRFWPRKYLVDSQGYIRYDHIGEGAYEETELKIQELLAEIGQDVDVETEGDGEQFRLQTTPELYAGYGFALNRGQNVGNEQGLQPGQTIEYNVPEEVLPDTIYLNGLWKSNEDDLELAGDEGSIFLAFKAKEVNIVATPSEQGATTMEVFINSQHIDRGSSGADVEFENTKAFVNINYPDLYNVFKGEYGVYVLELRVKGQGFKFNSFTFGG